ncbi:MAG: aminotransferase class I/II-fold pyridoxal phosphate-dependent enzyme, partial [Planctomycetes bacterium]|nr:aminotransferase class I/II-fold pyridoxal phosphate-dependent enzyme [Planctomycetota bacterium]
FTKSGEPVSMHALWNRRHGTKFNGVSYVTQAGAAAVYSDEGQAQIRETLSIYLGNAKRVCDALSKLGYTVFGGVNAPYIWLKTPDNMGSWDFFDRLLNEAHVVGTPGVGFGPAGEGYFRLTAFAQPDQVDEALKRLAAL